MSTASIQATLQSPEFRQNAVSILTVVAPPAAIVLQQGKAELDTRHLALSLALYCSFLFYLPAVFHAYWLLNIRDSGFEQWLGEKKRQAGGVWEARGGRVKETVDETIAKVRTTAEKARVYGEEKARYVKEKSNQVVGVTLATRNAVVDTVADLRDAYETGRVRAWIVEKAEEVLEKARAFVAHYPRLEAVVVYVEKRIPTVVDFAKKVYETIREKIAQWSVSSVPSTSTASPSSDAAPSSTVTAIPKPAKSSTPKKTPSKKANGHAAAAPTSPSVNDYESADEANLSQEL